MGNRDVYFHLRTADIGNKEMTKEATRNPCYENSLEHSRIWRKNGIQRLQTSA